MNRILIVCLLGMFYVSAGNTAPWPTKDPTGTATLADNLYDVSVNYPDAEVLAQGPPIPLQPKVMAEPYAADTPQMPDAHEDIETAEPLAMEEPSVTEEDEKLEEKDQSLEDNNDDL